MFLRDQVLEVRNVEGRIHLARKPRRYDEWDPPIPVAAKQPKGPKKRPRKRKRYTVPDPEQRSMYVRASAVSVWVSFKAWANKANEYIGTQKELSQKLEERGFARYKSMGRRGFRGLRVLDQHRGGDVPISSWFSRY